MRRLGPLHAVTIIALTVVGVGFGYGEVSMTADRLERIQVTDTLPPPSAAEVCNAQQYGRQLEPPAELCFRAVTAERGWSESKIDAWVPFAITADRGILYGESEHCPNRRAGDVETEDCRIIRCADGAAPQRVNALGQAYCHVGEDTGFGQVTYVWYGPKGPLCKNHGYCSAHAIVNTPYDSMKASVVIPIEMGRPNGGSDPWCFNAYAIRYHNCNGGHVPDR